MVYRVLSTLVTVMVLTIPMDLFAMRVHPLLIEMESVGRTSSATLSVGNEGANKLPVEVAVERLTLDENAQASYSPADDDWLIFPPQTIIPPGGQQNFRLQWLGEPELAQSQSYHVVVKQVPVALPEGQSGIQLVYNFRALVNVAPPGVKPELVVLESTIVKDKDDQPRIALLLENKSPAHGLLTKHEVKLKLTDAQGKTLWKYQLLRDEIFQRIGAGLVQPDNKRRFVLPLDLPETAGNIGVKVEASVRPGDK